MATIGVDFDLTVVDCVFQQGGWIDHLNAMSYHYISKEQYDSYLAQRQYVTGIISKDRYCIVDNNTYYELDVYPFWNDRATIEIELLSEDQRYQLPKFVKLIREVSSEPDYRNLALAQKYGKP